MRFSSSAIADSIGILLLGVIVAGCVPTEALRTDLRPLVAAAGAYALMQAPPAPGKCSTCGGRGKLGDGRIEIPCPECSPKQESAPCPTGKCPLPTRPIVR